MDGMAYGKQGCRECSANCRVCHGSEPAACDECTFSYKLASDGSGCYFPWFTTLVTFAAGAVGLWALYVLWHKRYMRTPYTPPTATPSTVVAYGAAPSTVANAAMYPSGPWRGYYIQTGYEHAVAEMDLQFSTEGQVSGGGVDDVGQYVIYGKHQRYEISFTKTYGSASQSSAVLAWAQVEWHSSDEGGSLRALVFAQVPARNAQRRGLRSSGGQPRAFGALHRRRRRNRSEWPSGTRQRDLWQVASLGRRPR